MRNYYQGHDKHQNQDNDYLGDGGWGGDTGSFNHICNFLLGLVIVLCCQFLYYFYVFLKFL